MGDKRATPVRGVRNDLLRILSKNANTPVHAEDIAEATNWTTRQIKSAGTQLIYEQNHRNKNWGGHVEAVARGGPYIYRTGTNAERRKADKRLFEEVSTTKSGAVIVQDYEGTLYVLKELDV